MTGNGRAPGEERVPGRPAAGGTSPPAVAELDTAETRRLAGLAAVFDDLQYVLLCCERLVAALTDPPEPDRPRDEGHAALVEALWTGALVGYVRCFSARTAALDDGDVTALGLEGDVARFHETVMALRDVYASRHDNPREAVSVGVALGDSAEPQGVAVLAAPKPGVDDTTVRALGALAFALRGRVDERIDQVQRQVLAAASALPREDLRRLPQVRLPSW